MSLLKRPALAGMLALTLSCAAPMLASQEQSPKEILYAKQLVLETVKANPGMLDMILHVTAPGQTDNYAIAAYTKKEEGGKSGDDDLGVIKTGKPLVEVQKDGVRIGVLVPLKDAQDTVIGALGLMFTYQKGEDTQPYLARAKQIRDEVSHRIASREALFEKVPAPSN